MLTIHIVVNDDQREALGADGVESYCHRVRCYCAAEWPDGSNVLVEHSDPSRVSSVCDELGALLVATHRLWALCGEAMESVVSEIYYRVNVLDEANAICKAERYEVGVATPEELRAMREATAVEALTAPDTITSPPPEDAPTRHSPGEAER